MLILHKNSILKQAVILVIRYLNQIVEELVRRPIPKEILQSHMKTLHNLSLIMGMYVEHTVVHVRSTLSVKYIPYRKYIHVYIHVSIPCILLQLKHNDFK